MASVKRSRAAKPKASPREAYAAVIRTVRLPALCPACGFREPSTTVLSDATRVSCGRCQWSALYTVVVEDVL